MSKAAVVVLSLVLSFAVLAQEAPPPLRETIEVQLTNLDVVVTDATGKHVTGLTKDDFVVLEDGQERTITNLAEVQASAGAPGRPAPRRILVAVDNRTIALSGRKQTIAAVRSTIDNLLSDPEDRLMVVSISGSPKVRTAWTADRAAISAALSDVENDAAATNMERAEIDNMFGEMIQAASGSGSSLSAIARRRQRAAQGGSTVGRTPEQDDDDRIMPGVDYNMIMSRVRSYAGMVAAETDQTISSLASTLNHFTEVSDGRRLVLLVGGALPVLPGSDVYQRLEAALREIERYESTNSGTGVSLGRTRRLTTAATEKTSFDMSQQIDALATEARLRGIAFYAVNPELQDRASKDVTSRHAGGVETQFSSANASVDGFVRLAAATGGYSHAGRNADVALSSMQSDLDSYYSLGYRSPLAVGPDTKIVVKPKNREFRARAVIAAAKLLPEWQIADTVVNNHGHAPDQNDLGIILVPSIANRSAETRQVKVNVMIPFDRLRLVREGRDYNCSFTVFVSVGDATGGANPQRETRTFKWSEDMVNRLRGKNLAYGVDLTLGPGRDRISVGIVDLVSGTTGYGRALLPSM